MRFVARFLLAIGIIFLLPALATAGWWKLQEHPSSWRSADWTGSGLLKLANADSDAAIYVLGARTGGLKGAFSLHCWIVLKREGADEYERFDKVGWGLPIRKNAYAADGRWYSNMPVIIHEVHGVAAEKLMPEIDAAIASYPYAKRGDYHIWPGPNSNSFVAYVMRSVPAFGGQMPPNAVGRDFAPGIVSLDWSGQTKDLHATFGGLFGFALGATSGLEIHFLGLVAGLDLFNPAFKIPAYGRLSLTSAD